jgi:hypothetical protein
VGQFGHCAVENILFLVTEIEPPDMKSIAIPIELSRLLKRERERRFYKVLETRQEKKGDKIS